MDKKAGYIYTMEYYSAIKKNTFESVLMRWIKLEPIIQSEVSQKEKHQYSMLLLLSHFSHVRLCATPIDGSPPGPAVPGILQARTLEWVAISFSNAWKWKWSHSVLSDPKRPHGLQPSRLLHPWDFPGKSTGVECHCLLQGYHYHLSKFHIYVLVYCIGVFLSGLLHSV